MEVEITFRVLNVNIKGVYTMRVSHKYYTFMYTFLRHADILNENKKKLEFSMGNIIFKWVIK